MLDELFQAYAAEHLQTDSTEDPKTVVVGKDPVTGLITSIIFIKESRVPEEARTVFETYYISDPSIASPGEFIMSILPYIRELDETERCLVTAQEVVVDSVFCFYRYENFISVTSHSNCLSSQRWLNTQFGSPIEPVLPHSFKLGTLCSAEKHPQSVFFAVKSVVLL
jgi:hypothetical protein